MVPLDIGVRADVRVSDISKVAHFRADAEIGRLDLHEIADLGSSSRFAPGRSRAMGQRWRGVNAGPFQMRKSVNDSSVGNLHPAPITTWGSIVTSRPIFVSAQRKTSPERSAWRRRHRFTAQPVLRDALRLRQLDTVVDAKNLALLSNDDARLQNLSRGRSPRRR